MNINGREYVVDVTSEWLDAFGVKNFDFELIPVEEQGEELVSSDLEEEELEFVQATIRRERAVQNY